MEKNRNFQTIIMGVLAAALLVMAVGYAAVFNQTLTINGTATAKAAKWDIHFDDSTYSETTGSVAATSTNIGTTSMSYNVTLEKPGDFYEFTIDVVNAGTFDAKLTAITLTNSITAAQANYLTYTFQYNGTTYAASTSGLAIDLKAAGAQNDADTATVKVRVEYVQPNDSTQLPTTDQQVTLNVSLDYQQATNS